ncbi:vitamin B12-dependent methionine synthase [Chytriomyces sp. MP71]|nr:vitamin B12-dependent methionine synthase [Chytriomyces sp. MP71]
METLPIDAKSGRKMNVDAVLMDAVTGTQSTDAQTGCETRREAAETAVLRYSNGDGRVLLPALLRHVSTKPEAPVSNDGPGFHSRTVVVMASVFGDCYDMGKNVVAALLAALPWVRVIDLGVSVPLYHIMDAVHTHKAAILGLSALITPSLNQMALVAAALQENGLAIPLLIGGAATTRKNTAICIAPHYRRGPTIHALDASRALAIVSILTGRDPATSSADLITDIQEEQRDIRNEILRKEAENTPSDMSLISIEKARANKLSLDWSASNPPPLPAFLGSKTYGSSINLDTLIEHINWDPFFQIMHLSGTYPHRRYPHIFQDPVVGLEARRVHNDISKLLTHIATEKLLAARAVVWFAPANTDNSDDIHIYNSELRDTPTSTLHGLRQESRRDNDNSSDPFHCIADFVAPIHTQVQDYIGGMAVTSGLGLADLLATIPAHDAYTRLLTAAAAECLTGALAELVHAQAGRVFWTPAGSVVGCLQACAELRLEIGGLAWREALKADGAGRGVLRLAPCFPQQPDHVEMRTLWRVMDVELHTGVALTETMGMRPVMAVNGLLFSHPRSSCFAVGKIGRDQLVDYAARRGESIDAVEKWLALNLE